MKTHRWREIAKHILHQERRGMNTAERIAENTRSCTSCGKPMDYNRTGTTLCADCWFDKEVRPLL